MKYLFMFLLCFVVSSQAQNKIAFLTNQSGNFDIFTIDENGKNQKQLTTNKGWDWSPKWSNRLKGILYNSNDTLNKFSIKLMDVSGKAMAIDTKGLEEYVLSPDGEKVLYTLRDNKNTYIGLFDLASETNKLLIINPSYNGRPDWSPNGQAFSFISNRDGNNELYVYSMSSGKQTRLTNTEKSEKYTSWMPDSKEIVYTYHYSDEKDKEHNDIFLINIEANEKTQITADDKFYQEIDVSPNGKKIVFHAKRNGEHHLYTIEINGKNERQITKKKAYYGEPEWIPISSD